MERVRRALWEMFAIGVAIGLVIAGILRCFSDPGMILVCFVYGLLFALPAWVLYRIGRFMVTGH